MSLTATAPANGASTVCAQHSVNVLTTPAIGISDRPSVSTDLVKDGIMKVVAFAKTIHEEVSLHGKAEKRSVDALYSEIGRLSHLCQERHATCVGSKVIAQTLEAAQKMACNWYLGSCDYFWTRSPYSAGKDRSSTDFNPSQQSASKLLGELSLLLSPEVVTATTPFVDRHQRQFKQGQVFSPAPEVYDQGPFRAVTQSQVRRSF